MAKGDVVTTWTSDDRAMMRSMEKMERKIVSLEEKIRKAGATSAQSSKKSSEGISKSTEMAKKFATALGGAGGVAGAIALVNKGFDTWIQKVKLLSGMGRTGHDAATAFAALQPSGKRGQRMASAVSLMAQYGEKDSAAGFDMIQAMQSISQAKTEEGRWRAGRATAETIYRARRVGVPTDVGGELETLGQSLGLKPGVSTRRAFVAGEASGRTPADLAPAAAGLRFWGQENVLGWSAAAEIAGAVPKEQTATYVKRAGSALGEMKPKSSVFKMWEKLGVGAGATRAARLQAAANAGLDTPSELSLAGVSEKREVLALSILIQNLKSVQRRAGLIERDAVPGLLRTKRAMMEGEVPAFEQIRRRNQAESRTRLSRQFGGRHLGDAAEEAEFAAGKTRIGKDFGWMHQLVDEEGGLTRMGHFTKWLEEAAAAGSRGSAEVDNAMLRFDRGGPTGAAESVRPESVLQDILTEIRKQNANRPAVRQDGPSRASF